MSGDGELRVRPAQEPERMTGWAGLLQRCPKIVRWALVRTVLVCWPPLKRREAVWSGKPWYAKTYPVAVRNHLAPDLFAALTFCGQIVSGTSSGEIRTLLGLGCGKCRRLARKSRTRQLTSTGGAR